MKNHTKAFTLVELLVVIAIIAILLSILMPSLERARKQATKVVCMSNMKQVTLAIMTYAVDNKNYVPDGVTPQPYALTDYALRLNGGWIGVGKLYGYKYITSPKIFFCPSTQSTTRKGLQFNMDFEWYGRGNPFYNPAKGYADFIQGTFFHRGAFDWKLDSPEQAPYTHVRSPTASYAFIPGKRPYSMLSCVTSNTYPLILGHILLKGYPVAKSDGSALWVTFKQAPTKRNGSANWQMIDRMN